MSALVFHLDASVQRREMYACEFLFPGRERRAAPPYSREVAYFHNLGPKGLNLVGALCDLLSTGKLQEGVLERELPDIIREVESRRR